MKATGSFLTTAMRHRQATRRHRAPYCHLGTGSRTEGAPVADNRYKPIGLDAPERGNDCTARDTVFIGQLRHRGQPLLWLPFTRVDSRT
jgi:hypothetical protein